MNDLEKKIKNGTLNIFLDGFMKFKPRGWKKCKEMATMLAILSEYPQGLPENQLIALTENYLRNQ